ncbi:hypothetical protein WA538_000703 [Blastocystis sp. DL]
MGDSMWQLFYATSNSEMIRDRKSYVDWLQNANGFALLDEDASVDALSSPLLNGMTSPSILPDNVNTLLIRNENVWTNGRYWKITFSDPLFLKQLLRNEISRDSLDRPVACHSMKPGHFFVVETERFRYTGSSISITNKGYGLCGCLHNPLGVDNSIVSIIDRLNQAFSRNYTKSDLFPTVLFGDIYSADRNLATIAPMSGRCAPFTHLYDPDAGVGSSGVAHCASVVPSSDFQQETHSENGTTAPMLDADGTPALEESPFSSFERWFHGGETIVLETPRLVTPKGTLLYGLDAFYPLPPSDATTLLEASIGVQCWFTQTFRHVFPRVRGREQWISVETTDNLWVYIGNTLVGKRWGVGVNGRVNVTAPLAVQGSKDYFSVSVFHRFALLLARL